MNKTLAFILCATLPIAAYAAPKKQEKKSMEWTGAFSPVETPGHSVITTEPEWRALWLKLGKPAPAADFSKFVAVTVFLGTKPTGGYGVTWEPKGAVIGYKVKKPAGMAIEALTQPWAIKLFPKAEGLTVEVSHD